MTDRRTEEAADAALARLFKSLADESRVRILRMLARTGEMEVHAICAALGQSQPAVSHHLKMLRGAGLIDYQRAGKFNRNRSRGGSPGFQAFFAATWCQ